MQAESERRQVRAGNRHGADPEAGERWAAELVQQRAGGQRDVADQGVSRFFCQRGRQVAQVVRDCAAEAGDDVEPDLGQAALVATLGEVLVQPDLAAVVVLIGRYLAPMAVIWSAKAAPAYQRTACPRSISARAIGNAGSV